MARQTIATEEQEQITVIQWSNQMQRQWPQLAMLHHSPNEGYRAKDKGAMQKRAKLKRMGTRAGWPDLVLPVRRAPFIGLAIEMKRSDGGAGLTKDQHDILLGMAREGWLAVEVWGATQTVGLIRNFLNQDALAHIGPDVLTVKSDGSIHPALTVRKYKWATGLGN